jgi:hypothetical protein
MQLQGPATASTVPGLFFVPGPRFPTLAAKIAPLEIRDCSMWIGATASSAPARTVRGEIAFQAFDHARASRTRCT